MNARYSVRVVLATLIFHSNVSAVWVNIIYCHPRNSTWALVIWNQVWLFIWFWLVRNVCINDNGCCMHISAKNRMSDDIVKVVEIPGITQFNWFLNLFCARWVYTSDNYVNCKLKDLYVGNIKNTVVLTIYLSVL